MIMDHIEIDNIEVFDSYIEVSYWLSNIDEVQQVAFKISNFEDWLSKNRSTSVSSYWDHWDTIILNELDSVILYEDMKHYLWYRFDMVTTKEKSPVKYVSKKPMHRVSNTGNNRADSESA